MGGPKGPNSETVNKETRMSLLDKLNSKDYASVLDPESIAELRASLTQNATQADVNQSQTDQEEADRIALENLARVSGGGRSNPYFPTPEPANPQRQARNGLSEADLAKIGKTLEDAKAGVGIYGVRRANYELANRLKNTPGSRQTILTNGQNSQSGVPSTGLMQNVGKK